MPGKRFAPSALFFKRLCSALRAVSSCCVEWSRSLTYQELTHTHRAQVCVQLNATTPTHCFGVCLGHIMTKGGRFLRRFAQPERECQTCCHGESSASCWSLMPRSVPSKASGGEVKPLLSTIAQSLDAFLSRKPRSKPGLSSADQRPHSSTG